MLVLNKYIVLLLLVAGNLTKTFCQNNTAENLCKLSLRERKNSLKTAGLNSRVTNTYDLHYINFNWEIDPNVNFIKGDIWYQFKSLSTSSTISFDCSQSLTVDSVIYKSAVCNYTHENELLSITLLQSTLINTLDSIRIYYHGVPVSSGFGSFEMEDHGQGKALWTLSEPYGAKNWWPCKQDLKDKIDSIIVNITTPTGNRAVSNGLLQTLINNGSNTTYTFKHNYPIDYYLIALAVSNYQQISDTALIDNKVIPINSYAYPQNVSSVRDAASLNKKTLHQFSNYFGAYPFANEQYGHCQTGMGGGMEHQTIAFEGYWGADLLDHELAHQWFGDKVTCASWKDIWLNEGFATYLAALPFYWNKDTANWIAWKQNQISFITNDSAGAVYVDDTSSVARVFDSRLSYAKGSFVLHMLRINLGDSTFYKAIKSYLNDINLAYRTATTLDLQKHLENASNKNLSEFFNDWVYGQGYPSLHLNWEQDTIQFTTNLKLSQTTSHSSVSFFETPVELTFKGENADTTLIINSDYQNQKINLSIPFIIKEVVINPNKNLLCLKNSINAPVYKFDDLFVHLYPNPFTDITYIDYYNSDDNIVLIKLMDLDGKLISTITPNARGMLVKYPVPVSAVSKGLYLIELTTKSGKTYTLKGCKL